MSRFDIKAAGTGNVRCEGTPTYHGSYMKPAYLEFVTISSKTPIPFAVGDYVTYDRTGQTFYLYSLPQSKKQASGAKSGESFVYSNVQFFAKTKDLEIIPFRDLVLNGTQYHFSSEKSFSAFEPLSGIAARLQANLGDFAGTGTWEVVIAEGITSVDITEAKDFSADGSCLDALNAIYETWKGIGWTYELRGGVHTIIIGGANVRTADNTTGVYAYGRGLTALKRNQDNADEFCTRLRVFGSERNLINRYYNKKDIYDAGSVNIRNLMLPISTWGKTDGKPDASKAYFESAEGIARYGLIEKTVLFDGSDNEEIYPSIEGATIDNLKDAKRSLGKTGAGYPDYYPTSTGNDRIDAVKDVVSMPLDNGETGQDSSRYTEAYARNISRERGGYEGTEPMDIAVLSSSFANTGIITATLSSQFFVTIDPDLQPKLRVRLGIIQEGKGESWVEPVRRVVQGPLMLFTFDQSVTLGSTTDIVTGGTTMVIRLWIPKVTGSTPRPYSFSYDLQEGEAKMSMSRVLASYSEIRINQIGFDLSMQVGTPVIAFKSGMCAGREFTLPKGGARYEPDTDTWVLRLNRVQDDSTSMLYPNAAFPIATGDKFVITGIEMPEEYIGIASSRLYALGEELFSQVNNPTYAFEPSLDSKEVTGRLQRGERLLEGMYMHVSDPDIIDTDEYVIIDTLSINEGEGVIPLFSVTLRDRKSTGFSASVRNDIKVIAGTIQDIEQKMPRMARRAGGTEEGATLTDAEKQKLDDQYTREELDEHLDGDFVHRTGDEEIGGKKTFTENTSFTQSVNVGGNVQAQGGVSAMGICSTEEGGEDVFLFSLQDVDVRNAVAGQLLYFDGGKWIAKNELKHALEMMTPGDVITGLSFAADGTLQVTRAKLNRITKSKIDSLFT